MNRTSRFRYLEMSWIKEMCPTRIEKYARNFPILRKEYFDINLLIPSYKIEVSNEGNHC